jgi:hypothetical protein
VFSWAEKGLSRPHEKNRPRAAKYPADGTVNRKKPPARIDGAAVCAQNMKGTGGQAKRIFLVPWPFTLCWSAAACPYSLRAHAGETGRHGISGARALECLLRKPLLPCCRHSEAAQGAPSPQTKNNGLTLPTFLYSMIYRAAGIVQSASQNSKTRLRPLRTGQSRFHGVRCRAVHKARTARKDHERSK